MASRYYNRRTSSFDDLLPLQESSNFEFLPPEMSELRVILLGNSWSKRSSVLNFMLGQTVFNTKEEPDYCQSVSGQFKEKKIVVINTPDLLNPNISENELTEVMKICVRLSVPGPHVFLLVLQPEDFTEEHTEKLQSILSKFSDRSFDHSLVLISTSREESSDFEEHPPLEDLIKICKYRYLKKKNLDRSELLTCLGQIVKENNGDHVSCDLFEDTTAALSSNHQRLRQMETQNSIIEPVKADLQVFENIPTSASLLEKKSQTHTSAFRIVLLGKSEKKQTKLANFIIKGQTFHHQKPSQTRRCVAACGEWRGKPLTVVKTPDIFSLSEETLRKEMKICVSLCPPGPNVLLLLVKPSDFTEENRKTLKFILSLFGQDAFEHSVVIITHERNETSASVNQLLKDCGGRYYNMSEDDHKLLMKKTENIVHENKGTFLTFTEESIKAALNLILCGRRGAGKTSAAKAILGVKELHSVSNSSECVKHQGEVCGRGLSLVELPALYGKPQEEVMEESFRCISLCDPEGVHAFILVLPVDPLTDEDKGELEIIQNIFSSRVNDFTMILFTVDSDPEAPAVVDPVKGNKDSQELLQSCGGRSFVLNMKNKQQIPELLEAVEKMRAEGSRCFTKDMFTKAQMEKAWKLQQRTDNEIQSLIQERMETILEEMKRKHEEEMKELNKKLEEQTEEETKLKATLMEKDEFINKEQQKRESEWEEEEKRWQKILETSEKIVQSEKKHWETSEKKLEQWKEEMKRDRDALDKERKDLWKQIREEDKQRLAEEKTIYRKLQEEYQRKRLTDVLTYFVFALLLPLLLFLLYVLLNYAYTHTANTRENN